MIELYRLATAVFLLIQLVYGQNNKDISQFLKNANADPDFGVTTDVLITSKGYAVQTHTVTTLDNYEIVMHRIVGNSNKGVTTEDNSNRPAVLCVHGQLLTSAQYVINFPENSLGFMLYDLGYDVWLGNLRGNRYSSTNTKISNKNPIFWLFSWDEMGMYDLPSMIDYIINTTGQPKIHYVGYSMSSAAVMVMLTTNTSYQDKLISMALMAPVLTVAKSPNPAWAAAAAIKEMITVFSGTSGTVGNLLPSSEGLQALINLLCNNPATAEACDYLYATISGSGHCNKTRVPVYLSHFPAGTSSYSAVQYLQQKKIGKPVAVFQKYDHGSLINKVKYGQFTPPQYDLSLVTKPPLAIFTSSGDTFSDQTDVDYMRDKLKDIIKVDYVLNDEKFTHVDFAESPDAADLFFNKMIDFIQKTPN